MTDQDRIKVYRVPGKRVTRWAFTGSDRDYATKAESVREALNANPGSLIVEAR